MKPRFLPPKGSAEREAWIRRAWLSHGKYSAEMERNGWVEVYYLPPFYLSEGLQEWDPIYPETFKFIRELTETKERWFVQVRCEDVIVEGPDRVAYV